MQPAQDNPVLLVYGGRPEGIGDFMRKWHVTCLTPGRKQYLIMHPTGRKLPCSRTTTEQRCITRYTSGRVLKTLDDRLSTDSCNTPVLLSRCSIIGARYVSNQRRAVDHVPHRQRHWFPALAVPRTQRDPARNPAHQHHRHWCAY